jgi:hypothetical protein
VGVDGVDGAVMGQALNAVNEVGEWLTAAWERWTVRKPLIKKD